MGRHTRKRPRDVRADAEDDRAVRRRWIGKVPLLPAVTGVLAIGAIVSAVSTKQISLNFAGEAPPIPRSPLATDVTPSGIGPARHGASGARGRASRGTARQVVTVDFRKVSASADGFRGEATIRNHGTRAIRGWTLMFRYPHARILRVSGGSPVRTGAAPVVRNPARHPAIAPGARVTVSFTARGSAVAPSECTFNGTSCRH